MVVNGGGLGEHVADAVVAVVDLAIVAVRAGQGEGVLDAGEAVEVVVTEELGVAAGSPAGTAAPGRRSADGFEVGDAVELVAKIDQLGSGGGVNREQASKPMAASWAQVVRTPLP